MPRPFTPATCCEWTARRFRTTSERSIPTPSIGRPPRAVNGLCCCYGDANSSYACRSSTSQIYRGSFMTIEHPRTAVVPVALEDGMVTYVEARILDDEERVAAIPKALDKALANVKAISDQLMKTLVVVKPKRAQLELGIEFAVEAGE